MKRLIAAGLGIFCLPALVLAQGQRRPMPPSGGDQGAIRAQYQKFTKAFKAGDVKAIVALSTPDFVWITPDHKKHNRREAEMMLKQQLAQVKKVVVMENRVASVQVNGKEAVATVNSHVEADVMGDDRKVHRMTSSGTSRDVWSKTPSGWLIKSTEDQHQSVTLDGQPLGPDGKPIPQKPRRRP